ncbi:unnamed protein product, partial [Closterium sp. NIES-53]
MILHMNWPFGLVLVLRLCGDFVIHPELALLCLTGLGRPVQFDTWLDDLQLYLLSDSKDSVSRFDLASGAATAPPATADNATRSQWLTRDAAARLAICNHLPLAECAHFGQHRTVQALYDAVVARYSSPATTAQGRLLLPYLFPELSAFATVEDLHLLVAETSAVGVGAARGTPRPPFFEGCSPSPLAPSYASAAAPDVSVAEDVGAASASAKRRSSKGKGGKCGGGGNGSGGGGSRSSGGGSSGGGGGGGTGGGSGGSGCGGGGSGGSGGSGGGGTGGSGTGARRVSSGGGQRHGSCPYVIRTGVRAGQTCGKLHTQHHCFSRLDNAWHAELGDDVELPRWADLLRSRIAIFDLNFDAILSAMYALSSGTLPGIAPAQALHTFTLDSGASRCFFRDSTTLLSLHLSRSDWLTPLGPRSLPVPPLSSHVRQFRPIHYQVFTPLVLYELGEYRCPPRCDGHYHHSWRSACVDLHVHTDTALPGYPLARVASCRTRLFFGTTAWVTPPCHAFVACTLGRERYFLLVVDDYTRYTKVFPLRCKGQDLPVLRLHSDRGGEFSSNLLRDFCRGEGILKSFTLPHSPQQNGIAERRLGLVMEVARTSMILLSDATIRIHVCLPPIICS